MGGSHENMTPEFTAPPPWGFLLVHHLAQGAAGQAWQTPQDLLAMLAEPPSVATA